MTPAIDRLVAQHNVFRLFVAKRMHNEQAAEDVLQTAYAKAVERQHQIREHESVVAWFYRLLRNSITDHYRHAAVESRRMQYDSEADLTVPAPQLKATACECVMAALDSLKPDYANAIRQVDIGGAAVQTFGEAAGISADNASVRLHRARKALAKEVVAACGVCAEHKCVDCDCRSTAKGQL